MWFQGADKNTRDYIPSRKLYDYCMNRDWFAVIRFCQDSHDEASVDAAYQGDEGTPLHVACKNRPSIASMRALLSVCPAVCLVQNPAGDLPLHAACRFNASVSIIRELTRVYPVTASMQEADGSSAVTILTQCSEKIETKIHKSRSMFHRHLNFQSTFWQKVIVLLEAVASHRQTPNSRLLLLHAAASLQECPKVIILFVLNQFPHQIRTRDCHGQLPLHLAVGQLAPERESPMRRFHNDQWSLIQYFIACDPSACREPDPSRHGRYPLHTALISGYVWRDAKCSLEGLEGGVIHTLVHHAPDTVSVVDPVTGLEPFQLAAIRDLDTSFALLRFLPSACMDLRVVPVQDSIMAAPKVVTRLLFDSKDALVKVASKNDFGRWSKVWIFWLLFVVGKRADKALATSNKAPVSNHFLSIDTDCDHTSFAFQEQSGSVSNKSDFSVKTFDASSSSPLTCDFAIVDI